MKLRHLRTLSAATLIETAVAAGVFMVVTSAIVSGVVALQRNFNNTGEYAVNHSAQLRISDYIARDLRHATSFRQEGTGESRITIMELPNYMKADGTARDPVVNADGTVSYQDPSVTPPKKTVTVRYYKLENDVMYREVDGVPKTIADNVDKFDVFSIDSATDPNATANFNLAGTNTKVAEVKVQVRFKSRFGSKEVVQVFYNTTLMRNKRTDAQTSLY